MRIAVLFCLVCLFLVGCARTSVVMLEGGAQYAPTASAELLTSAPTRPFKPIAILETRADAAGVPLPKLLESMRDRAASIGAHAVMPPDDVSETTPQGVIYNPWLGGYQTTGGATIPVLRAIAIRYLD